MKTYNIGIVGATGLVGGKMLEILAERNFPIRSLYLFASAHSHGKEIRFQDQILRVEGLSDQAFEGKELDFVLFSAGGDVSKYYAPLAAASGALVIDNSSAWRMDPHVPLVVAEVNPQAAFTNKGIIANPNCSTIQSVLPLKALLDHFGIKRVSYTTYQAVSGAGVNGILDLQAGTAHHFPHSIKDNILPQVDAFLENGYTKEEIKMMEETRKILELPDLKVTATAARVPIENTHAVSINIETDRDFDMEAVRTCLREFPGIVIAEPYPLAQEVNGHDEVYVGRIRRDESVNYGLNLWCVGDNVRKGAATNTVQIAELFVKRDQGERL